MPNIAEAIARGSRNTNRMREDIKVVVGVLASNVETNRKGGHDCPNGTKGNPTKYDFGTGCWRVYWWPAPEKQHPELHVECELYDDRLGFAYSYPGHDFVWGGTQVVYRHLDYLAEGIMKDCPRLQKQLVQLFAAAEVFSN